MRFLLCILTTLPYLAFAQPNNNIFFGGYGDGSTSQVYNTGFNSIYLGGIGDGNAHHSYEQPYIDFKKGGEGDGWSASSFVQPYFDFRKGGEGDGWAIVFRPEGPLPVNILLFHAEKTGSSSLLKWIVENETNVERYEIERSIDGRNFTTIGTVASTGYSGRQQYSYYDHQPNEGINYYRLKNIDSDGSYKYSTIATLYFDQSSYVSIYPNPASDYIFIAKGTDIPATFVMIDGTGRIVKQQKLYTNSTSIDVSNLPSGLYRYTLYDNIKLNIRGSILIY